ncbi:MAG: hypothetical protein JWR42_847 [Marmoricola sp.]|nr:hypothetical protein [Marmoricola sp.]
MDRHNPLDVAAAMRSVAHELGSRTDLASTLDTLVHGAVTALPDVDHAGISIAQRRGRIETVATTDPFVDTLDELQYSFGEGPCVDAVFEEPVVRVQHARHETRWPRFMPPAVELGLRSQLGIRLYTEERTIGVLNLYSTSSDSITDEVEQMAELFAAYATSALGRAQGQEVLDSAMASRQLIGQATGIVMERFSMDEGHAFEYLLRVSSLSNTKLRDISREMVESLNKRFAVPVASADLDGAVGRPDPTPGGGLDR